MFRSVRSRHEHLGTEAQALSHPASPNPNSEKRKLSIFYGSWLKLSRSSCRINHHPSYIAIPPSKNRKPQTDFPQKSKHTWAPKLVVLAEATSACSFAVEELK